MAYDIGPKIGITGETEFRQQLQNVNQQIKTLDSEMKNVTETFVDNDDSQAALSRRSDILAKKIEAQKQKVNMLAQGMRESAKATSDTDTKTLKWEQALNEASAELKKMQRELTDTQKGMMDFGEATDKAGGFLNKIKSFAGSDLGGALLGGLGVGAAVVGVKSLAESLMGLEESTREYRRIMGSLEISSQNAGYAAEETKEIYMQLYGVLGDAQSAATTTANLQAIGLAQSDLMDITNAAIGAWATYGDSIPIDGLAESINETIQAGKVTGTFADVLNWAGQSEDEFNSKLAAANSTTERSQLVLDQLATQGLVDAGKGWRELNGDIVAANEAQSKMEEAMGNLGTAIAPAATALMNFGADTIGWLTEKIIYLWDVLSRPPTIDPELLAETNAWIDGSHANGLWRVPYDGYNAILHEDEMVVPADPAKALRERMTSSYQLAETDFSTIAAGMVGGLQTAMEGAGGSYRIEIPIIINGREFSRGILPDLRAAMKADPEVVSG